MSVLRRAGSAGGAPVGSGDDFQVVAIGVGKVDTAPAITVVDLAGTVAHGVGPVLEAAFADAAEDGVEIGLTDQEGVVLRPDRTFGIGEVAPRQCL
jgi:hypothetical protein